MDKNAKIPLTENFLALNLATGRAGKVRKGIEIRRLYLLRRRKKTMYQIKVRRNKTKKSKQFFF